MSYVESCSMASRKCEFDYFLVLDFEATCEDGIQIKPQEIIEFPVLKVNARTFETEAEFHEYVQPTVHRKLTNFCTVLTGITQDMVTNKPCLGEVLQKFHLWMQIEGLFEKNIAFATCGDWDLKTMLPSQCKYFGIEIPVYMRSWINIKKSFAYCFGLQKRKDLMGMLNHLQIPHIGRHHSGIDDCRNIAKILKAMVENGFVFQLNGRLHMMV